MKKPNCSKCGKDNTSFATNAKGIKNVYVCHDCAIFFGVPQKIDIHIGTNFNRPEPCIFYGTPGKES